MGGDKRMYRYSGPHGGPIIVFDYMITRGCKLSHGGLQTKRHTYICIYLSLSLFLYIYIYTYIYMYIYIYKYIYMWYEIPPITWGALGQIHISLHPLFINVLIYTVICIIFCLISLALVMGPV